MKIKFFLVMIVFFLFFSSVYAEMSDVEKIILKLQNLDHLIEPPDERTAREIYEEISLSEKSELLERVVEETLIRDLWDEIESEANKKELIKAGLTENQIDELLEVWDELREERDFILKKKDELSENDEQLKSSFENYMEEYIKDNNPHIGDFEFEYDDLERYTLDYFEQLIEPEHIKVNQDRGVTLMLPLTELPMGLKKIIVNATHIVYENDFGGKFLVNISDVYPTNTGDQNEWEVKGFKDLAQNPYDVFINFGKNRNGIISTIDGGFIIDKNAFVELDNRRGTIYRLMDLEDREKNFIVLYDNQVYVFRGIINVLFNFGSYQYNITEVTIDKTGVLTDVSGRLNYQQRGFRDERGSLDAKLSDYQKKFLSLRDDNLFQGEKLMIGNFNEVLGRKFHIHSEQGIDFELDTINQEIHSGHLVMENQLVFQHGFINGQRNIPGASNVFFDLEKTRIGSTLVDLSNKRGSINMGKNFIDFFSEKFFFVDRYFGYRLNPRFINERGLFG